MSSNEYHNNTIESYEGGGRTSGGGERMNGNNNDGIAMVNIGEASFSLADTNMFPCVPSSTELLMKEDVPDTTKSNNIDVDETTMDATTKLITTIIIIIALTSIACSVFIILNPLDEASLISTIAFCFPIVIAPYVIYQRYHIQWLPTFRTVHNKLRDMVCDMAMQRNKLENENNRLQRQITRLSAVEGRLEHILQREGKDIKYFKNVVYENGATLREMQKIQAAIEMQDLFSVILRSDRDGNNVISEKEMNQFVLRMKRYAGTRKWGRQPKFNEQAVREAFSKSLTRTVQSLININVTASMVDDDDYDNNDDEEMGRMQYNHSTQMDPPDGFEGSSMNPVDVTNLSAPKDDVLLDGLLSSNSGDYQPASNATS